MTARKAKRKTHKVSWNEFQHARAMKRKQGYYLMADLQTACGADAELFAGVWRVVDCARCLAARKAKWKVPLDALVASARNPTKAYTATVAPKPDDAVARAREIEERHRSDYLHLGQFVAGDRLQERISDALRAERTRALEDAAEMCERDILGGYGHGAARDIRALKEKP